MKKQNVRLSVIRHITKQVTVNGRPIEYQAAKIVQTTLRKVLRVEIVNGEPRSLEMDPDLIKTPHLRKIHLEALVALGLASEYVVPPEELAKRKERQAEIAKKLAERIPRFLDATKLPHWGDMQQQ